MKQCNYEYQIQIIFPKNNDFIRNTIGNCVATKILNRKNIFEGNYLQLERLQVQLPDGRVGEREIVRVRDAVAVLPMDAFHHVHLVRQHRPAIEQTLLEIPAGLLDDHENEEAAAIRECKEETGYKPRKLTRLLRYAHAEGYSTGFITLFLGEDLEHTGQIQLYTTEYLEPVCIPFDELRRLVQNNEIVDSKTILSTLLIEKAIVNK